GVRLPARRRGHRAGRGHPGRPAAVAGARPRGGPLLDVRGEAHRRGVVLHLRSSRRVCPRGGRAAGHRSPVAGPEGAEAMSDDRFDLIDAAAHLAEETADDVRAEAIRTGRTVRTTPKPK